MKLPARFALLLSIALSFFVSSAFAGSWQDWNAQSRSRTDVSRCLVTGVHDGDTFTCRDQYSRQSMKIRMAEIDAPELSQAFGQASATMLRSYIQGQTVEVYPTGDVDRGRVIAHVVIERVPINALMVKNGGAWVYTRFQRDERLSQYQAFAKRNGLGLWASARPIPPWEYRQRTASNGSSYSGRDDGVFRSRGYNQLLGHDGVIHRALYKF